MSARGPARVLVVDDEPAVRLAVERALARAGYEVRCTASPDSACELVAESPVDLVLLDLRMPQMRGDVLFLALTRRWPHLAGRVVLMSGDPESAREGWPPELRACPVLAKPFTLDELYDTVAAVLRAAEAPPLKRSNGQ